MAWVATAIIGASAVGAAATAYSANKASEAQQDASRRAADTQLDMYERTRSDLEPFRQVGITATNKMNDKLDFLTSPIELTQDWLESTPGYQFTKEQGLKSVQNSAAARGLGVSGAALKGAATFATGLADNTYKTQFDVENTNRTNAFNRLKSLIDTGESAAAKTGAAGTQAASGAASAEMAGGNAAAAGYNAIGGAVKGFANDVGGYAAYKGLYGNSADPGVAAYNAGNPIY
jgi:hypothetical protein